MELESRRMERTLVENVHVRDIRKLPSPEIIKNEFPASERSIQTTLAGREAVRDPLHRLHEYKKSKLIVVVGPCSIHDPEAAMEYASWLLERRKEFGDQLELIMRVYFEKPRTTIGWKGLINDPHLDETFDIESGLRIARKLVCDITDISVPIGTEILDTITPDYFAGLVSWGAIGARTTESQLHRELASGLSFPVGFKNGTGGSIQIAVDGVTAAKKPHHFIGTTEEGLTGLITTKGNPDCHIILRGGSQAPNYYEESVSQAISILHEGNHDEVVMIDLSHKNSGGDFRRQKDVAYNLRPQIIKGRNIMGIMIESNIEEGKQEFVPGGPFIYGKSITDACAGLNDSREILGVLHEAQGLAA